MSTAPTLRLVVDTNVLLRALANPSSQSGTVIRVCESRRAVMLLSKAVMDEYRLVLMAVGVRHKGISPKAIETVLRRLRYFGDYIERTGVRFELPRDPTDAKWLELAIDQDATHLLTFDDDLLHLPRSRGDAGKRFRQRLRYLTVQMPDEFLTMHGEMMA